MSEQDLPGMKQKDIRKCDICGLGVAHDRNIDFYVVTVEQWILNPRSIQQQHGLELVMGGGQVGAVMAQIMGPNPDIANQTGKTATFMCQPCAMKQHIPLTLIGE